MVAAARALRKASMRSATNEVSTNFQVDTCEMSLKGVQQPCSRAGVLRSD